MIDTQVEKRYAGVPCIAVGWSRPATFTGEYLRKPVRSKQLIDSLRRCFKVAPIGMCWCVYVCVRCVYVSYDLTLFILFLKSISSTLLFEHTSNRVFRILFLVFVCFYKRRPC